MTPRPALCLTLLSLAMTFACTREAPPPAAVQQDDPSPAEAPSEAAPAEAAPKIAADEAVYDFGSVAPKGTVEHVFTIRNEGDADLHIERVQKT